MNRLRELRKNKRMTLDDIAKQTKINRGTYNNYESGKTEPKKETWQALANFYGVSVPYLKGAYDEEEIFKLLQKGIEETSFNNFDNSFEQNYNPAFKYFLITTEKVTTKTINTFIKNIPSLDFIKKEYGFVLDDLSIQPLMVSAEYANFYSEENIKKLLLNAIDTKISKLLNNEKYYEQMVLNYSVLNALYDEDHSQEEKNKMIELLNKEFNPPLNNNN